MTAENQKEKWGIGKIITVCLLIVILAWELLIAYLVHDMSRLFREFEPANYKVGFMVSMQPVVWVMIILTLGIILDIAKRKKFLILKSILVIAIIVMANSSLSMFLVMESYEPILNMESK